MYILLWLSVFVGAQYIAPLRMFTYIFLLDYN